MGKPPPPPGGCILGDAVYNAPAPMRVRAAILSLLPGVAHVDLGKAGRGIAFFALFALLLNAALLGPVLSADPRLRAAGGGGAAAIWVFAFVDALRLAESAPRAPEVPSS